MIYTLQTTQFTTIILRLKKNLHQPDTNLTQYQNGVLCKGTKMYNSLPTYIKEASTNTKKFAKVFKMFLYEKAFYTLNEFYTYHCDCHGNNNNNKNYIILL